MKRLACLWCVLAAAGCHDLPDVAEDECGNLVVEANEDCDGFDAADGRGVCGVPDDDNACHFTCIPNQPDDFLQCPPGWGCADSGRCEQPSGYFYEAEGSPWSMPVDQLAIGDVDGDGNDDLVGNNQQQIMVRFGNTEGKFAETYDLNIRRPNGPVTYDYFNSDLAGGEAREMLDVIVPIEEGLFVLLGDEEKFFEPVAYAPFVIPEELRFALVDVPSTSITDLMFISYTEKAMAYLFSDAVPTPFPPAAVDGVERRPVLPIPAADIVNDASVAAYNQRQELVIAYPGDSQIHIYRVDGLPAGPGQQQDHFKANDPITLSLGAQRMGQRALFADVDGNGEQDLMVELEGEQVGIFYTVSRVIGPTLTVPEAPEPPTIALNSGLGFPLAAADLNFDDVADYVFRDALVIATGGGPSSPPEVLDGVAVPLQGRWSDAVIADFNADFLPDVAVAAVALQGVDLTGIDILLHSTSGFFNRFHLNSERPPVVEPRTMAVGDFDGDTVADVAFAQHGDAQGGDELLVGYGSRSAGFGEPVEMGELENIVQVQPTLTVVGRDTLDGITDLMVVSHKEGLTHAAAVMIGDSSRRMIAPYLMSEDAQQTGEEGPGDLHRPLRALVGDFDGDLVRDILAIALKIEAPDNPDQEPIITPAAWVLPGVPEADGGIDTGRAAFKLLDDAAGFNFFCSTWDAVDLSPYASEAAGNDLIGMDSSAACGGGDNIDPHLLLVEVQQNDNGQPVFANPDPIKVGGDLWAPHEVQTFDLGGDFDADPVVIFRGDWRDGAAEAEGASVAGSGVAVLWNREGTIDTDYGVIPAPDGGVLYAVAAIKINEDDDRDLIIVTETGVYQSVFDVENDRFGPPEPIINFSGTYFGGQQVGVGDLNGDGLEDIAIAEGGNVHVLLAMPAPDDEFGKGIDGDPIPIDDPVTPEDMR